MLWNFSLVLVSDIVRSYYYLYIALQLFLTIFMFSVFRASHPYTFTGRDGVKNKDTHGINSARLAEVWMDDYKRLFYLHRQELQVINRYFWKKNIFKIISKLTVVLIVERKYWRCV